jgi:hypothetical protein
LSFARKQKPGRLATLKKLRPRFREDDERSDQ